MVARIKFSGGSGAKMPSPQRELWESTRNKTQKRRQEISHGVAGRGESQPATISAALARA